MTEAEALAQLRSDAAADTWPTLTEDDLRALLVRYRIVDADGNAPSDTGWTPTWNLAYATGMAWKMKAGKTAGAYDLSTDGQQLSRGAVMSHCLRMANEYLRGAAVAVAVPGGVGYTVRDAEDNTD